MRYICASYRRVRGWSRPRSVRLRIARDGIVLLSDPADDGPRSVARAGIEHGAHRALKQTPVTRALQQEPG